MTFHSEPLHTKLLALGQSLNPYPRVAIAGGPLTGKSLVAEQLLGHTQVRTDDFMHVAWPEQPFMILTACERHAHFVLSGVQTGRVLRKGLRVDVAVFLTETFSALSSTQQRMAAGCKTIFSEWHSTNPLTKVLWL